MRIAPTILAALVFAGAGSTPAHADIAARFETVDEDTPMKMEMTLEADENGNVRIQIPRLSFYYLLTDGDVFQVTASERGPTVIRIADLLTVQAEIVDEFFPKKEETLEVPKSNFARMGQETVGGRIGTGYGIVTEEDQEPQYASLVISDNPQLAPIGEALADSKAAMAKSLVSLGSMGTMLEMMDEEIIDILRQGAPLRMLSIELTDVSLDPIPPERLALPAEPLTLDQLRNLARPELEEPPTLPPHED